MKDTQLALPPGQLYHGRAMRICAATFATVLLLCSSRPVRATELTPDVHARLFAPTAGVKLTSTVVHVPMRGTDSAGNGKCPYFQVYVNGHGPFTFLYDTGAAYAMVSSKVIDAVKPTVVFDRGGRRDVVELDRIALGDVTLTKVWAIHDDNFGIDGIIGFPTLGVSNVLFDFSRREILVSTKPIPMTDSFTLPYESPLNVPTVPLRLGDRTVRILLDTGDDAYGLELKPDELGNSAVEHLPTPAATVLNGAHKQQTSITTLKDPVYLGPVSARHAEIPINASLPVGDLGYDALRQFRFQLDPKQHVVLFEPLFEGKEFSVAISRSTPASH
jgi:hypothetical protein